MSDKLLFKDYGFNLYDNFDVSFVKKFISSYEEVLQRRKTRWDAFKDLSFARSDSKIKRFVRKGIPDEYRSEAWFVLSGAKKMYDENLGSYNKWSTEKISEQNESVILADVPRTFPENKKFLNRNDPESLLPHLQRILTAFVVKNPSIGYCQGMNFIAGLILLVMMPEEEKAFWVFDTLITDILQSYYIPGMLRIQVDCMVLEELLKKKLPEVHHSITVQCGGSCVILSAKWFICTFVDVLPIQTSLRVLDCVMCEGDKILFRAALAIIRLHQDAISKCASISDLMMLFREILKSEAVLRCHEFSECMFTMIGSMSQKTINNYRKDFEEILTKRNQQKK